MLLSEKKKKSFVFIISKEGGTVATFYSVEQPDAVLGTTTMCFFK